MTVLLNTVSTELNEVEIPRLFRSTYTLQSALLRSVCYGYSYVRYFPTSGIKYLSTN